jgi:hypothetical protein
MRRAYASSDSAGLRFGSLCTFSFFRTRVPAAAGAGCSRQGSFWLPAISSATPLTVCADASDLGSCRRPTEPISEETTMAAPPPKAIAMRSGAKLFTVRRAFGAGACGPCVKFLGEERRRFPSAVVARVSVKRRLPLHAARRRQSAKEASRIAGILRRTTI